MVWSREDNFLHFVTVRNLRIKVPRHARADISQPANLRKRVPQAAESVVVGTRFPFLSRIGDGSCDSSLSEREPSAELKSGDGTGSNLSQAQ